MQLVSNHMKSCKFLLLLLALILIGCGSEDQPLSTNQPVDLAETWISKSPSKLGLDNALIESAIDEAATLPRMRSLLVAKDGYLVSETYFGDADRETLHDVRSVTKSVVATLVAIALDQNEINSLDDKIDLGEQYPLPSSHRDLTYQHLLTMTAGLEWDEWTGSSYGDWITSEDEIQYLIDLNMVAQPGTSFTYNSGSTHMLGYALAQAVGMSLPTYADQVLFDKIGIANKEWEITYTGANGGAGLDLSARDLLRFGQLYLQNGLSGDDQIISSELIKDFTTDYHELGWTYSKISGLSYSHLWWTTSSPYEAFFAWGYGGQYVVIVPEIDMVVVSTTEWRYLSAEGGPTSLEMQVLDLIFTKVIRSGF